MDLHRIDKTKKKEMKIVHVCITGIWGEQYAYQENLLPHYQRIMSNEVTIIAPVYSSYRDGIPAESPSGVSYLNDGTKLIRLNPLLKSYKIDSHLHLVKGLADTIADERPDLLFAHDLSSFNYLCLPRLKKMLPKMKIVFDNHIDTVNSLHHFSTRFLHKTIYRHLLVPQLSKVSEVFYGVTPSRCDFLRDVYGIPENKIRLLVMGADDEKMHLDEKQKLREEVRTRYGVCDLDFLVVTGGKIDLQKNAHVLAQAVGELAANVKLLIFGSISQDIAEYLKTLNSDKIILTGWISSDDVYRYFYAADLVVFPGLHSVLWEQAVASRMPCAFAKIAGFEHVSINGNCILMDGNNVGLYKEMLLSLINGSEKYRALKTNADTALSEMFLYGRIAKKVIDEIMM